MGTPGDIPVAARLRLHSRSQRAYAIGSLNLSGGRSQSGAAAPAAAPQQHAQITSITRMAPKTPVGMSKARSVGLIGLVGLTTGGMSGAGEGGWPGGAGGVPGGDGGGVRGVGGGDGGDGGGDGGDGGGDGGGRGGGRDGGEGAQHLVVEFPVSISKNIGPSSSQPAS